MNSHLIGRIGKDGAKIVEGQKGKFLSMDVATEYYSRGENRTLWVRVRCNIDRYVEKLAPHLTKGSLITVEGQQLEPNCWIDKEGQPRAQIVLVANFIDFVKTGKKKDGKEQSPSSSSVQQQNTPFPTPADNNDDLPF